jgi:hypothetical protein
MTSRTQAIWSQSSVLGTRCFDGRVVVAFGRQFVGVWTGTKNAGFRGFCAVVVVAFLRWVGGGPMLWG